MAEEETTSPEEVLMSELPPQHSEALAVLGFSLDAPTRQLQAETTQYLKMGSTEQFRESIGRFHDATALIADATPYEDRPRILTGIALATAEIHLRAGNTSRYLEDLREVIMSGTRQFSGNRVFELLDGLRQELEGADIEAPVTNEWLQFLVFRAQAVDGLDIEETSGYIVAEMFRYRLSEDQVTETLNKLEIE